jgi:mannose-6-phosphate isomerase-like protein (cupin superfamily)
MIQVIDTANAPLVAMPEGRVRTVLSQSATATRVHVAVRELEPGWTFEMASGDRTRVAYILEGDDALITHVSDAATVEHSARRRTGIYLEPDEAATVTAGRDRLTLLLVSVPKHTARATGTESATGYFFEEANLRSLVDEKQFRERTFWVNKETGLSGSWDLQLGRMQYAPHAHSPRHVHHASTTSPVTPEHFYFIERGTGEVRHDTGRLPVGPGSLVLIPAGEWHQLVASGSGFDYIEFQAPFDFVTTMDHDPLGKNWYIKGTDDGTGKPKRWVQS